MLKTKTVRALALSSMVVITLAVARVPAYSEPAQLDLAYTLSVKNQAEALWSELQLMRYDAGFHQAGLGAGGPMHDWNNRRKSLYAEWTDYTSSLPIPERLRVDLATPLHLQFEVAKDWAFSSGIGTPGTDDMVEEIDRSLAEEL